ncbi:MAG: hypothetical protein AAFQ22_08860 [Pseudomonadota bacterium]
MKLKTFYLSAAICAALPHAVAQTDAPLWTVSTSGSWSQIDTSDRDAVSVSVSLSRVVGDGSVGASLATSNGSDALFNGAEITDRSSLFASAWVYVPVGAVDLDLSVSYGREDFDGRLELESERFDELDGTEVDLTSEVDSLSLAATLSRVFIVEYWDIIPSATLGWSQSEATSTAVAPGDLARPAELVEEQSGMNAAIGLGLGYVAHDQLYLFSDLSALYAENGASTGVSEASRLGGLRASQRQAAEEVTWAEASLGASFYATDTVTLSVSGGTTAGREEEEVFATTSLSISF